MQSKAKNISLANTTLIIKITFAIIILDVTDLLFYLTGHVSGKLKPV